MLRCRRNIFVAASRTVHDDDRIPVETRRDFRDVSDSMRRFQSRNNAFCFRQQLEAGERFFVSGVIVLHPAKIAPKARVY